MVLSINNDMTIWSEVKTGYLLKVFAFVKTFEYCQLESITAYKSD